MSEWISVKDRLPEADECVLLVEKLSENNWIYTTIRYRNLINEFVVSWNGDEYRFSDIDELYWMPLPEPPKEDEEENRRMARQNYYDQLSALGYNPDGTPKEE